MTTITLPRATVEQALEILEKLVVGSDYEEAVEAEQAMESFRAALAQQAEPVASRLRAAAQAVLDRWDSPKWEWANQGPTADLMAGLRAALAQQAEQRRATSVMQQALEILESDFTTVDGEFCRWCDSRLNADHHCHLEQVIESLKAALAQQAEPDAYGYASRLAVAIWEKHYKDAAPQWKPLDDLMGVLTQIDNMTSGLTRLAQQAEPVQEPITRLFGTLPVHDAQQPEPVEPVAWAFRHSDGTYHDPSVTKHSAGMVPLYPPPPQLLPLTDEEIVRIRMSLPHFFPSPGQHPYEWVIRYTRLVEAAHNITDPQIEDRLARHGIPMPGDPKC